MVFSSWDLGMSLLLIAKIAFCITNLSFGSCAITASRSSRTGRGSDCKSTEKLVAPSIASFAGPKSSTVNDPMGV